MNHSRHLAACSALLWCLSAAAQSPALGRNWSQYVAMPDGVRLAVDVWLPENPAGADKLPTLVSFTRYWRAEELEPKRSRPDAFTAWFNRAGYAVVVVDVRGTGASFGYRKFEFSLRETLDYPRVIDWIASQAWSNGRVAAVGTSYMGNAAEASAFTGSPALRAVVPRFTDYDWYAFVLPGGLQNTIMSDGWGSRVWALDMNRVAAQAQPGEARVLGVKPVDGDADRRLLERALVQHRQNTNVKEQLFHIRYRDDVAVAENLQDAADKFVTLYKYRRQVEAAGIPAMHWGSWMDSGTAAGVLARFASYDAPARYVIGPWDHGAKHDANPFNRRDVAVEPSPALQNQQIEAFLSPLLKGDGVMPGPKKLLRYFTMGENLWKETESWPPKGSSLRTLYFGERGLLSELAPVAASGADDYAVNFSVGTGSETRWSTQSGGEDVYYGDRASADRELLTYTSRPLEREIEITGYPLLRLQVASTHEDGAVIGYLEAVAPDGSVMMISEGQLRLVHRAQSEEVPPYPLFGPYRSFARGNARPMVPGKMEEVSFALLPTSIVIPKGYSLRLALAGHDKDSFRRLPETGDPVLTIGRNALFQSVLELPLIDRPQ